MTNLKEEMAKEIYIGAMSNSEGLASLSEDELKAVLKEVKNLCQVFAEAYYEET